jgi:hypothetical protein
MTHTHFHPTTGSTTSRWSGPGVAEHQAYLVLRTVFVIAPIAFGLDKFFDVMTDWDKYLAPWINDIVPGSAHQAMLMVGVVEIIAGLVVAFRPKFGGYLVAAWLLGIIINLVTLGDYWDVGLRDFGLFVAAVALARLANSPAASALRPNTDDTARLAG